MAPQIHVFLTYRISLLHPNDTKALTHSSINSREQSLKCHLNQKCETQGIIHFEENFSLSASLWN
jgi:hypothetical protein